MPGTVAVDADGLSWPRWAGLASALMATTLVAIGLADGVTPWRAAGGAAVLLVVWLDCVWFVPRWLEGAVVAVGAVVLAKSAGDISMFLVVLVCGEVGTTGTWLDTALTLAVAIGAVDAKWATTHVPFDQYGSWNAGAIFAAGCGVAMRMLMRLNSQLHAAQATVAEQAASDERRRLAREIHDVIAHSMTVTMLHISAARLALQDQPASVDDAIDALREAETQGRRSLADIRQTVGLLASDDPAESALGPPVPGVEDLPDLVSSYEAAGLTIDLDVRGDLARLSPAGGVTLYRVLQEGLANAAKHAPGAPVAVRLFVHRRKVAVCVNNGLSPHAPLAPPGGRGVAGMTDRVRQLGGRLRAGPTADGWQLRADLPLSSGWGSFGASCADDSEPVSVDQS